MLHEARPTGSTLIRIYTYVIYNASYEMVISGARNNVQSTISARSTPREESQSGYVYIAVWASYMRAMHIYIPPTEMGGNYYYVVLRK